MDVACGDYDRRGTGVSLADGGDMGHVVMVLSGGRRYQVLSAVREGGVTPDPVWVGRHFSSRAAAEIDNDQAPLASTPDDQALRAFGCSTGVTPTYEGSETWPCR